MSNIHGSNYHSDLLGRRPNAFDHDISNAVLTLQRRMGGLGMKIVTECIRERQSIRVSIFANVYIRRVMLRVVRSIY